MKEILFKAKRVNNGEWVVGYYVCFNNTHHFIYSPYAETDCGGFYPEMFEIDIATLCQYTGLTDKNGNKIWENDVVKVDTHESNLVTTQIGATCSANIVEWECSSNYTIKYCPSDLMNLERWVNRTYITCEVIGNVFDNPELVKEKD